MYRRRIADDLIDAKSEVFGAINIVGPKGSGKTTTAEERCVTKLKFQDEDTRTNLLLIANTRPSYLLNNDKPILLDEWQDAPKIWGAVRTYCDNNPEQVGAFYLTGSTSMNIVTPHTGTLRISKVTMYPMSLYETGESNGQVSLKELFDNPSGFTQCKSDLSLDDLIFSICRGGWPRYLVAKSKKSELLVAKDLYEQTYSVDISNIDGVTRNPTIARLLLQSYARNICTLADNKTIIADINANYPISETTYFDYVSALEKLYIIKDIEAWCPAIRSKTAIRSGRKRNFIDPSIAVAALGASPEYFKMDFHTLGFLFESLCIRDLMVYSSNNDGKLSYYHDRYDLEADGVLHLEDGRYALIEFKLGEDYIEEGAKHLNEIERLVKEYNSKNEGHEMRLPDLKIVLTGETYGVRRPDGVLVIPIGCLKD